MKFKLVHVSKTVQGAFGVLLDEHDIPVCLTLERTFDASATIIPDGSYRCVKSYFNKGGYSTFEIQVEGHSRILFHKANVETELSGCIGLGFQFGRLYGQPAILQSGLAFNYWWSLVQFEGVLTLEVS